MVCTECGSHNRDEARFCASCGSALPASCAACGTELVAGARFCDACGAPVAEAAEAPAAHELRKTVTVVFADVVGSTILQERLDPESVRRVMSRFYESAREAIEAHDGQVVKFIGDGVMAAFGTPVVREDDALRAVRAATAMVDRLEELNDELERDWGVRLHLRTGVNTGEVVVDRDDGDVVGDPVNVAARLEQAAGDGEVLVGEETRRLVRHDVSLEPVAPLELKGKGGPVVAFRLLAVAPAPGEEARIEAPLVGRDGELARLRAVFEGAVADRSCRLVTVVGSPGIGKTRLAHELARIVEDDATVLEGRCQPADEGITFAPIAEVLRTAAAIDEADPPETAREKLTRLLPDDADRELLAERALGVLGAATAASTEETFWAIRRVLEVLAEERPLVLVLDDLHWGQPTFLDLVEHLAEWARDVPLLLVALARPELRELREALVGGRRVADVIELDALDAAESRTLVDELLGQADLPEALAARVLHATEGNPLFVGETVRMLVDEGVLERAGDSWVVSTESIDVEMPPTIHAMIAARLERLRDDERGVVERASVIGKQFYRGAVAQLCSPPVRRDIDGHLETLRRKELVEPEGTYWIDEPVFRFHHVLIRDAAYRSVLKEARAELHERFADWLESKAGDLIGEHEEVVAFHLEQAHEYRTQLGPLDERGRALGQRAGERLASAGRRALAREDLPAAANLLGRALDRLEEGAAARPSLLADLAEALLSAGDTHGAAAAIESLRAGAGDDQRLRALATVYAGQLAYLTDSSRLHETVVSADAAAEELAALGDETGVAKARHVQAVAFARLGQVGACEGALDRALAAARSAGDGRRVSAVLSGAPQAALWGPSPVVRASGRCLDVVRILRMTPGNRHLEAAALSCQAVLEAMRGRGQQARAMLDGCRATFEELGLGFELLETEVHAGIVELLDGDPAAAEGPLRSAYEGFTALGAGGATERAAALLARTLLEQGRDDEADKLSRVSEERGGEDLKATIAWCGVRAEALARRGEHADAEELARRGVTMAEATDALTDHADARMALAAVLREAGRDAEAAEEARRALELYDAKENEAGARRAKTFVGVALPTAPQAAPTRAPSAPPSVAWARVADGLTTAMDARDVEGFGAIVTEDIVFANHRRAATWQEAHGAHGWVELQEPFWEASPDVRYSLDFIEGDDIVSIARGGVEGHLAEGGGEWSIAFLAALRLRGDRLDRVEIFDEGEEAGVRACAERLRAEAAGESANRALGRRWADSLHARDWEAWRACHSPDLVVVDHRIATPLDPERDLQTYEAQLRALVDEASDAWLDYEIIVDVDGVGAIRGAWRGHLNDGGGEFETPLVVVTRRDGDRYDRFEVFDPDDDAAWCARVAELLGERGGGSAVYARWLAAYHARDWDAYRSIWADDLTVVDHRQVGVGEMRGFDAFMDFSRGLVELAPDLRAHVVRVLDVTPTLGLVRQDFRGHAAGGGEIEVPYLILGRIRDGLGDLLELFDPAEEAAARRRFAELAGTADLSPNERLIARFIDAVNARDWDAATASLTDDFVSVDRRSVSVTAERDRAAYEAGMRALVDQARDARLDYELVADIDEVASARCRWHGHLNDGGGEFELPFSVVGRRRGDRFERLEFFETDDDASWGGRFAELLGERGAALAVGALWVECHNARDWDGLCAIHAEDAIAPDHRKVGGEELRGPDEIADYARRFAELVPDVRCHVPRTLAATASLWLVRADFRGHGPDGGEIELPYLSVGLVRDGLIERNEAYDPDDEDAAWRRYEELAVEPELSPNERLVRHYADALNARDWEAADACLADELQVVDHRVLSLLGRERDRTTHHAQVRALADQAGDVEAFYEVVADLDDVIAVRGGWRGHLNQGGGEFETPFVLMCRRSGDRFDRLEAFETDDDAGLCARLGELLRERGTALAVWAHWTDGYHARDWAGLRALCADDITHVDRRPVGFGELHGSEAFMDWTRRLIELAPDARLHLVRVVDAAPDRGLIRFDVRGHTADGGELEVQWILLACFRDGLIQRNEMYDPADEANARRRYDELAAETELSANERLAGSLTDALNRRDWDAAAASLTDDFAIVDTRLASTIGPEERDAATLLAQVQALIDAAADARVSFDVIADVENLTAARFRWRGHFDEGGGEFEIPFVMVGRRRGDRFDRSEVFDPDDDAPWCARFGELLGERGTGLAAFARWAAGYQARDWDAVRASYTYDTTLVDRRPVGGGEVHGVEAVLAWQRSLVELAPDIRVHVVRGFDLTPRVGLVRFDLRGHTVDGGAIEVPYLNVGSVRDGLIERAEFFDPADEDAAHRRFEELAAEPESSLNEGLTERFTEAFNRRDWDAVGECWTDDYVTVDSRPAPPLGEGERDWPTWRAQLEALVETSADVRGSFEVVADFDEVIAVRYSWCGHWNEGGGEFEIPYVGVGSRRGDRFERTETFAADDDAPWCARFAELLGERGAALAAGARATACYHARDWDGFRAAYADDATMVDRRKVGLGDVRGRQAIGEFVRGLVDHAPDMRLNVIRVLELAPDVYLGRHDMRGHAAEGGGEVEVPYLYLVRARGETIQHVEIFDPGNEAGARRRFEEVGRPEAPAGVRELIERLVAAYNERDWETFRAVYSPELRFEDRRVLGWGALEGPDPILERVKGGVELVPDVRMESEVLALGRRAVVHRMLSRGHAAVGGGALEVEIVSFALVEDGRIAHVEFFDGADAGAALARFEEIGAQTEPERLYARVCRSLRARDWEALGDCFAEDFESIEHRTLGWEPLQGREAAVELYRSWVEVAPDAELGFEALAGSDERLAWLGRARGHAAEGGGLMEYVIAAVSTVRDGRIARSEYFAPDDEAAALARLAEPAPNIPEHPL